MPSYGLRNMAWGLVDGSCQEMEFSSSLHRRVQKGMLGDCLVIKDSLIMGEPKFTTSEREEDVPRDEMR